MQSPPWLAFDLALHILSSLLSFSLSLSLSLSHAHTLSLFVRNPRYFPTTSPPRPRQTNYCSFSSPGTNYYSYCPSFFPVPVVMLYNPTANW